MKKYLPWALISVMFICVFLLNYYAVPGHDELSYAFQGQHTPVYGEVSRVNSIFDIVYQQYHDYTASYGNGRVWTHGIVAAFAGFKLYTLFDAVNTCMWFLLVWLVLHEGGVRVRKASTFMVGGCFVWWFLWYAETCSVNAAFALNYLWVACASVAMMKLWRTLSTWWAVPLFFFYGWSSEIFVLPMVAALAGGAVIRSIAEKRWVYSAKHIVAWWLMLIGAYLLCFGPAAQGRASASLSLSLTKIIFEVIKAHIGMVLLIFPAVLVLTLLLIIWKNKKSLGLLFYRSLEWWVYLSAVYGLFCLTCKQGLIRLSMAMLLAAVILIIRERDCLRVRKGCIPLFVCICFGWMLGATLLQIRLGHEVCQMLALYKSNPYGLTIRGATSTGFLHYTVNEPLYNRWHRSLFRRELEHTANPTFLTAWLYNAIYEKPDIFFAVAKPLGETGLYVAERCPLAVVARGHMPLTEEEKQVLDNYFADAEYKPIGWKKYMPGRFRAMFPSEDYHLGAAKDELPFIAKDGQLYTLYISPLKK